MDYLFFDTECANCLHGEGKICSFGYVRTDENFHVLKKKDIHILSLRNGRMMIRITGMKLPANTQGKRTATPSTRGTAAR